MESRTEPASSELETATMTSTAYQLQTAMIGQQLLESDYHVLLVMSPQMTAVVQQSMQPLLLVLRCLKLKLKSQAEDQKYFRIECVEHDDNLVCFYTGFVSYTNFIAFFDFLGPVVHQRSSAEVQSKIRSKKSAFLTLVKLRLNLKLEDLSFRFGLSVSLVFQYITTWICFLYHVFMEVDWMPSVEQVKATLPSVFKEKFATTYAIIDGSEIFIDTIRSIHAVIHMEPV